MWSEGAGLDRADLDNMSVAATVFQSCRRCCGLGPRLPVVLGHGRPGSGGIGSSGSVFARTWSLSFPWIHTQLAGIMGRLSRLVGWHAGVMGFQG
jgi:hypothetical protein